MAGDDERDRDQGDRRRRRHDTDNQIVTVTVSNVGPVVTAAADQSSNEGARTSFTLGSFTDPGADSPWDVRVDWGDGSPTPPSRSSSAGSLGSQLHTYADGPSDYTVTVTVTDKDGAIDSETFSVHVNNVAPSIAISGAASVNEGSPYRLKLGAVTDPGADTVTSWLVHWGDGSTSSYTTEVTRRTPMRRPERLRHHGRPDRRGRHLHRPRQRSGGAREQRGADDRVSGAASANEGSTHTYTYAVSRSGCRHAHDHGVVRCQRHVHRHAGCEQLRVHVPGWAGQLDGLGDRERR